MMICACSEGYHWVYINILLKIAKPLKNKGFSQKKIYIFLLKSQKI